ncbi:MAG TPA: hypothetical protein VGQ14_00130 [Candidatus Eisenbacteria bacterium]|jgi:hypothetical protein|nr:hypothetical protein [Candidatus Eisenbacteria bacterium]
MRSPLRHLRPLVLGLAVLLAAAGCSNLPTSPVAPTASAPVASGESSQILGLLGSSSTTTTTKTVGLLGGTLSAGDFTLVVPPLALTQTATITVRQPDPARPVVELSISPASANRFLVPVLLTGNASKMDRSLLSVACISYWNPATSKWEPVSGSTVSVATLTVSAPLSHFSTYRVESGGKAGW